MAPHLDFFAYHLVELVVVLLGIETLLHRRIDDIRQEIIRDRGIAVPLLEFTEARLEHGYILAPATIMEINRIEEYLPEELVDIDLLEIVLFPVVEHTLRGIGREEGEGIEQRKSRPSGEDGYRMLREDMVYIGRAVDSHAERRMRGEGAGVVEKKLFVPLLYSFQQTDNLE